MAMALNKNKFFAFAALALLLLLAGCIAGRTEGVAERQARTSLAGDWQNLALMAIFATVLLLGLAYALASAFNSNEFKAWALAELTQAVVSLIILASVILLFASLSDVSRSLADTLHSWSVSDLAGQGFSGADVQKYSIPACDQSECHIVLAQVYLSRTRDDLVLPLNRALLANAVSTIGASTFKYSFVWVDLIPFLFGGFSQRPNAGLRLLSDRYMLLFDYTTRIAGFLSAQAWFLAYLQQTIVPIFLVAGIVMRSVFFLRRLGGLMIAVAIGLFTVYPLMHLLAWYTLPVIVDVNTVCFGTFAGGVCTPFGQNGIGSVQQGLAVVGSGVLAGFEDVRGVGELLVPALVFPLFNIVLTISFIKVLSGALGGDIEIEGLARLI